jgi:hypothetical protein
LKYGWDIIGSLIIILAGVGTTMDGLYPDEHSWIIPMDGSGCHPQKSHGLWVIHGYPHIFTQCQIKYFLIVKKIFRFFKKLFFGGSKK